MKSGGLHSSCSYQSLNARLGPSLHEPQMLLDTYREASRQYANKYGSELCRNCVRWGRKRRGIQTFTSSDRHAFQSGKSLNRMREKMFWCHSMRLAGIVFQACSFIRLRSCLSSARARARCRAVAATCPPQRAARRWTPRRRTTTRTYLPFDSLPEHFRSLRAGPRLAR